MSVSNINANFEVKEILLNQNNNQRIFATYWLS